MVYGNFKCKTISEFWFQALYNIGQGYKQEIERGSFEGDYRLQYPFLCAEIEYPMENIVPQVPIGVSQPTTWDYIQEYFNDYILRGKEPEENEQYTYSSRISPQLDTVLKVLSETPNTNQATISISQPTDIHLSEPPCLRSIDFKVINDKLCLYSVWRSHDLFFGLPTNLGGLALLQQMVAEYTGKEMGRMYYYSSGSHIYSYQIEMVEAVTKKEIK